MTLALAGLGAIGKLFGNVFFIVKIAGAIYLICLVDQTLDERLKIQLLSFCL